MTNDPDNLDDLERHDEPAWALALTLALLIFVGIALLALGAQA